MKKVIFLCLLISTFSCKKEWFDYTNKYTGKFEFTNRYSFFDLSKGVYIDTTYIYVGTITRVHRGTIKIKYGGGMYDFLNEEIDKSGKFADGSFSDKDNLEIYFQSGGHGGGTRNSITGIRK